MKSFYEILGVAKTASAREIRQAFLGLAHQHHPDLNRHDTDADQQFKFVRRAYEVLSDPIRRAAYDETPALFPLSGEPATGTDGSTIVTQPQRTAQSGNQNQFHFNLDQGRRSFRPATSLGLCIAAAAVLLCVAQVLRLSDTQDSDIGTTRDDVVGNVELPRVETTEDTNGPRQHSITSKATNSSMVANASQSREPGTATKTDEENKLTGAATTPREFQLDELQELLLSTNVQPVILPRDESYSLLIPNLGVSELVVMPDAPISFLPVHEHELQQQSDTESAFQQLLDTPLPELRDSDIWLSSDVDAHERPSTSSESLQTYRNSREPIASPIGRSVEFPSGTVVSDPAQRFPYMTGTRPMPRSMLTSAPAPALTPYMQVAPMPNVTGSTTSSPITGMRRSLPAQPHSPVENKHQPYRPFNPLLPTMGAGINSTGF